MNRKEYIMNIYNLARVEGLCSSKQEFASLIGVNRSTLSNALSGDERYSTRSLESRVRLFAKAHNLDGDAPQPAEPVKSERGVFLPEETRQMFENLTETIKLQARLLDRLQGGDTHQGATAFPAQKNFTHK